MWQHGGLFVGVWHPFCTGRLARWLEVVKLIEYMLEKGKVWFAPMEAIAAHVEARIADGSYAPRIDHLPYYAERVSVMPLGGSARTEKAAE